MRLIDAEELLKEFDPDGEMISPIAARMKIVQQPTAYDVDKVVQQLEKCKRIMESPVRKDCYNEECRVGDCTVCAFEKAVEIVKAGGTDENR